MVGRAGDKLCHSRPCCRSRPSGILPTAPLFGGLRPVYYAAMDVPHYWTADQVQRLPDALSSHNRHQARTACLIMWRAGRRVPEVLQLEWRDLDHAGDPPTLPVRRSKTRRASSGGRGSDSSGISHACARVSHRRRRPSYADQHRQGVHARAEECHPT